MVTIKFMTSSPTTLLWYIVTWRQKLGQPGLWWCLLHWKTDTWDSLEIMENCKTIDQWTSTRLTGTSIAWAWLRWIISSLSQLIGEQPALFQRTKLTTLITSELSSPTSTSWHFKVAVLVRKWNTSIFVVINVHNAHHNGGKMITPLTSIARIPAVSFCPLKILFPARIILVGMFTLTKSFVAVLVLLQQPTGGLVDICKAKNIAYTTFVSLIV